MLLTIYGYHDVDGYHSYHDGYHVVTAMLTIVTMMVTIVTVVVTIVIVMQMVTIVNVVVTTTTVMITIVTVMVTIVTVSSPQMLLTILYTLVDVNTLIPCTTSVEWATYSLTFAAFLKFRYTDPHIYRPIKVRALGVLESPIGVKHYQWVLYTTIVSESFGRPDISGLL